jgi:hypothetical protein
MDPHNSRAEIDPNACTGKRLRHLPQVDIGDGLPELCLPGDHREVA